MERSFPDFGDAIEWNLVGRKTVLGILQGSRYYYPPQTFVMDTFVGMVGLRNEKGLSRWFLGARASGRVLFLPSSTSQFTPQVESFRQNLRLGILNLIVFPRLLAPWLLQLDIPYWHEQMLIEVWRYDGRDIDAYAQLAQMEAKLDQI